MTRVLLWIATNMAILLVAGIVMSILGLNSQTHLGLLVMCAIFGFGGSFISLMISKWMAKKTMGCNVIENPRNETERWLLDTVARQAEQAQVKMPEVAIFESNSINAFATGSSKNNSLVAVSTELLQTMTREEAEAVLAHEMSHVASGDMVTMCLLQGVINTFVMFAARLVASAIDSALKSDDDGEGLGMIAHIAVVFVLDMIFGILASFIINYYSRIREYKADEGGALLSSKAKMIAALERLKHAQESDMPAQMAAFGIHSKKSTISELLMSHPPLEKRIESLRNKC